MYLLDLVDTVSLGGLPHPLRLTFYFFYTPPAKIKFPPTMAKACGCQNPYGSPRTQLFQNRLKLLILDRQAFRFSSPALNQ